VTLAEGTYPVVVTATNVSGSTNGIANLVVDRTSPAMPSFVPPVRVELSAAVNLDEGAQLRFFDQPDGTISKPFRNIDEALLAAEAGSAKIVRIVGNRVLSPNDASENTSHYQIGIDSEGNDLPDGRTFNVPAGMTVMVDAGAVFRMRKAIVDVGSSSQLSGDSRTGAALQLLGVPGSRVMFSSLTNVAASVGPDGVYGPSLYQARGEWGGIVFRGDSDWQGSPDVGVRQPFVNTVQQSVISWGGGQVTVDSNRESFAAIQVEGTQPTLAFTDITVSAGSAIAATPNSFEEGNGRRGLELRGNRFGENSINGVFIKIETPLGGSIEPLEVAARLTSTEVVYVLQENLVIAGGAGGFVQENGAWFARPSGRLQIDPGVVVKLQDARIELSRGQSQLIAEGEGFKRVVFTSLADTRFGAGGTFDTNGNRPDVTAAGDWAGIIINAGGAASIDRSYLAFAGGQSSIEGTTSRFNAIEVHQGDLRLANSRLEFNADGNAGDDRDNRGTNTAATVFVRGAQPIIIGNDFRANAGAVVSINTNSLNDTLQGDPGRQTNQLARSPDYDSNFGPLIRDNRITTTSNIAGAISALAALEVRPEEITVEGVWDDTDIVHYLGGVITVNNFHTATGLRLLSEPEASLVVKFGSNAGITASGTPLEIDDRIGGTVQIVGQPGYPVVMTSIADDLVGASLDANGFPVTDTNVDGAATSPAAGDWRGLQFLELSNDRNVAIYKESEPPMTAEADRNKITEGAEYLGVLAPNYAVENQVGVLNTWESAQEKSGDDNRRLGFEVHGFISSDNPGDVDLYRIQGYAGSEVWIDIDKTSPSLDTMVEVLDASGNVLARSVDSLGDITVVPPESPEVVNETSLAGSSRSYSLAGGNILPGTLGGVVYVADTAQQTFTVDRAGAFTFEDVGDNPNFSITGASLDRDTGIVDLTFNGTPVSTRIEVSYEHSRLSLATLGFTAGGLHGGYSLNKDSYRGGDSYSTNPRDAGMRVELPGTRGTLSNYFIRVRSQPRPTGSTSVDFENAVDSIVTAIDEGATSGRYELRVRLRQQDEKPGSTVRYAEIKYPQVGIDVVGLPNNSPLVGTTGESTADNNSQAGAQELGSLLTSDRNTISVAGSVSAESDVDWYSFTVDYDMIQSIGGVNNGAKTWATVFDIDYADGFRGDLTLSVFDAQGQLIYVGRDSNVADDQPDPTQLDNDVDDLSRGSFGKLDPFIGTVQLPAGGPGSTTRYYVAVSSNERLPQALNAYFQASPLNSQIRLEPINSLERVVEDHIGSTGYSGYDPQGDDNVTHLPATGAIIDITTAQTLSTHVRPFTLADVTLFVSTGGSLFTIDPFTGTRETTIVSSYGSGSMADLDMRTDGTLMTYVDYGGGADLGTLQTVNPADGNRTTFGGDGIKDDAGGTPTPADNVWAITGSTPDAVAIRRTGVGTYASSGNGASSSVIVYSVRDNAGLPGTRSVIYGADNNGNAATSTASPQAHTRGRMGYIPGGPYSAAPGAGESIGNDGGNNQAGILINGFTTGLQYRNDNGDLYGVSQGGQFFRITQQNATSGNWNSELTISDARDFSGLLGGSQLAGLATAPVNLEGGRYQGMFFAITTQGELICIDPDGDGSNNAAVVDNLFDTFPEIGVAQQSTGNVITLDTDRFDGRFAGVTATIGGQSRQIVSIVGDQLTVNNAVSVNTNTTITIQFLDGIADSHISSPSGGGVTGLAFSPLDTNLWHPTNRRGTDAGHGVNSTTGSDGVDNTRGSASGGTSMYFGLEDWHAGNEFQSYAGQAGQYGVMSSNWQRDLVENSGVAGNTYNLPGGAHGSLVTNSFSLAGYEGTDKPTLYFNYFLDTEDASSGSGNSTMRDSARVLGSRDGGVTWHLLATNNQSREAEMPKVPSVSSTVGTSANQHVQELFDAAEWRQARVDLSEWAGESSIQLRFDFSTAGEFDSTDNAKIEPEAERVVTVTATPNDAEFDVVLDSVDGLQVGMLVIRTPAVNQQTLAVVGGLVEDPEGPARIVAIDADNDTVTLEAHDPAVGVTFAAGEQLSFFAAGTAKNDITGLAGTTGNYGSAERGANNDHEGFYIDDIIVGFAERGEMVTGATQNQTDFFDLDTPSGTSDYPAQVLAGAYQLEIRRGTEYVNQPDSGDSKAGIAQLFNTNDRLVRSPALPSIVLAENELDVVAGPITTRGAGVTPTGNGLAMAADINAIFWSVDLGGQPEAILEFDYGIGAAEQLTDLPATFTLAGGLAGGGIGDQLPNADGVAISTDGGVNWTTVSGFTATSNQFRSLQVDLTQQNGTARTLTPATVIGFFQAGMRSLANGGGVTIRNGRITTLPPVETSGLVGDSNSAFELQQGQFLIEANSVTNAASYGIRIDAGRREDGSNAPDLGVPRNLATLNNARLVPGVVVSNNVVAGSGTAGIYFAGTPDVAGQPTSARSYGRIINNTVYGLLGRQGNGIEVRENASPTIMNNVFSELATAVDVDASSRSAGTVLTYSAFNNVSQQTNSGMVSQNGVSFSTQAFVDAGRGNFYPYADIGDPADPLDNIDNPMIDSSANVLQDRSSYTVVTSAIGVPNSPILAPQTDLYGLVRDDDPDFGVVGGVGSNAFKDRGAVERLDQVLPTVVLAVPADNTNSDKDTEVDSVVLRNAEASVRQIVLQLNDIGIGLEKQKVEPEDFLVEYSTTGPDWDSSSQSTAVFEDYVFQYNQNTNQVILASFALFEPGWYRVTVNPEGTAEALSDRAGNVLSRREFTIQLTQKPAALQAPTVVAGDEEATISFVAPEVSNGGNVSAYRFQYREGGTGEFTDYLMNGTPFVYPNSRNQTAEEVVLENLTNYKQYEFRIAAINEAGLGVWSEASNAVVTRRVIAAPSNLSSLVTASKEITLTWAAPVADPGNPITGYRIELSLDSGTTWSTATDTDANAVDTTAILVGLVPGAAYTVRVAAVTTVSGVTGSEAVTVGSFATRLFTAEGEPNQVAGLVATPESDESLTVDWSAPGNGGSPVTGYNVEYSLTDPADPNGAANWIPYSHSGPAATVNLSEATDSNLTSGTPVWVQVQAVNEWGAGAWSQPLAAVMPSVPAGTLALQASALDGAIELSWTYQGPAFVEPLLTDFIIEYREAGQAAWTPKATVSSNLGSYVVTGLTAQINYEFRVTAKNEVGPGVSSVTQATLSVSPLAPAALQADPQDGAVSLEWTPPGSVAGTSPTYRLQWLVYQDGIPLNWDNAEEQDIQLGVGVNTYSVSDPDPTASDGVAWPVNYERYVFRIALQDQGGIYHYSQVSSVVVPRKVIDAPSSLDGVATGQQITLTWTEPDWTTPDDAKNPITGYQVELSLDGGANWLPGVDSDGNPTNEAATLSNLEQGAYYLVRVAAVTTVSLSGEVVPGTPATTPTPIIIEGVPAKVSGLLATRQADGSLKIDWSAPGDGDSSLTGYNVEYSLTNPAVAANWTSYPHSGTTPTVNLSEATDLNLTMGRSVWVQVRASNALGDGAWSDALATAMPDVPTGTLTIVTTDVSANDGRVLLEWDYQEPALGELSTTAFVIEYKEEGGAWQQYAEVSAAEEGNPFYVENVVNNGVLSNGTAYEFRVTAKNDLGVADTSGLASSTSGPVTPRVPAAAPQNLVADQLDEAYSGKVRLTWTAPSDTGGLPISGYNIQMSGTAGVNWANAFWTPDQQPVSDATGATITSLNIGEEYRFRVRALTDNDSVIGSWATMDTDVVVLGLATEPLNFAATVPVSDALGGDKIDLSWTAPNETGGLPITHYRIQYGVYDADNGTTWGVAEDLSPDVVAAYQVDGLAAGFKYQFRLAAVTDFGQGAWTTSDVVQTVNPALLLPPVNLQYSATTSSVTVAWSEPEGGYGTGLAINYKVEIRDPISDESMTRLTSGALWTTFNNLPSGKAFEVRVQVILSSGLEGEWTDPLDVSTAT
jgi:hypothetical protein